MKRSTIAAICTPHGFGGVGIIKVSGTDAVRIARTIFRSKAGRLAPENSLPSQAHSFEANRIKYGVIVRSGKGDRIDEVLLSTMRAPKSYTGEDVVEINAHGGPVVLNAILETVLEQGAVLAQPGEFTRRAFLHGRIDLTQAEAVIDLINAKTAAAANMAHAQMAGQLRVDIEKISENIRRIIAQNEAMIDFPEDIEGDTDLGLDVAVFKKEVLTPLHLLLERYREGRVLRDGVRMAVVGRPNVGKSSLMNRLVKEDKVIVTSIPGTTRDAVEDYINIRGVPVVIVDTAGLQKTENPVEIIGIEKTLQNISHADLILFLVEAGAGVLAEDLEIYKKIEDKTVLIVINKRDLEDPENETRIPKAWSGKQAVRISALTGEGLDKLEAAIYHSATEGGVVIGSGDCAPNLRQKLLIQKSLTAAQAAVQSSEQGNPGELTALDLAECLAALDEILGINLKEDILSRIFSDFCIGK
jgi:tRNA modification GTPase